VKTNTSVPDSERTGENRIIRRDTECVAAAGGLYRLSEAEQDRHLLIVLLRQARAELAAARLDAALAQRSAGRWKRLATKQAGL
jgi:transcriptional regulator NrdR family protein